ncbi:hypothetical protein HDU96_009404 [Phlyctochytrium bullatum]|nr:hypothetical protein HDU96_009404 [Phlyctochytrium bullatum]
MADTLRLFHSLWGTPKSQWDSFFSRIRQRGFAGVEASLSDIHFDDGTGPATDRFFRLLKENNLDWICGIYTSWDDYATAWSHSQNADPAHHIAQFRTQLSVLAHSPSIRRIPVHINSHTGSDCLAEAEAAQVFEGVLEVQRELLPVVNERAAKEGRGTLRIRVSHETHRGRILFSPWAALRLASRFTAPRPLADDGRLLFTLDLSHWVVVSERLLPVDILRPVLEATAHVHARAGTPQHPQVDDPASAADAEWVAAFDAVWSEVWRAQRGRGEVSTVTPEYGPVDEGGYMRQVVVSQTGDRRVEKELHPLIEDEAVRLRTVFSASVP